VKLWEWDGLEALLEGVREQWGMDGGLETGGECARDGRV
jgi:hypothetical protein